MEELTKTVKENSKKLDALKEQLTSITGLLQMMRELQPVPSPSTPTRFMRKSNSPKSIKCRRHKNSILIDGDTIEFKEIIKKHGALWNRGLKGWLVRPDDFDGCRESLESADGSLIIEVNLDVPESPPAIMGRRESVSLQEPLENLGV